MKKSKLLALALAGAMMATLLAGCGNTNASQPSAPQGSSAPEASTPAASEGFNLSLCIAPSLRPSTPP